MKAKHELEQKQELEPEYVGFEPGAAPSRPQQLVYVNLRAGRIGHTSDRPLEGHSEHSNFNKAGQEFKFYAKTYDHLTGYIDSIRWHSHPLPDGTKLSGWNITVNCGKEGVFVLGIGLKDRPFRQIMNVLLNVDFTRPARFVGFWGEDRKGRPQKVLLISQHYDPVTNKPVWVRPAHEQKWLSRLLIGKLKEKVPLTEDEERNVSRMSDGSFNKDYPYIVQNTDESWSFDTWNNFLHEQMEQFVIPAVEAAAGERRGREVDAPEYFPAEFDGPVSDGDDDIPF